MNSCIWIYEFIYMNIWIHIWLGIHEYMNSFIYMNIWIHTWIHTWIHMNFEFMWFDHSKCPVWPRRAEGPPMPLAVPVTTTRNHWSDRSTDRPTTRPCSVRQSGPNCEPLFFKTEKKLEIVSNPRLGDSQISQPVLRLFLSLEIWKLRQGQGLKASPGLW